MARERRRFEMASGWTAAAAWPRRLVGAAACPVIVWLVGLVVFAVLGCESLLTGGTPVFVVARVTAYLTMGMVAAMTMAFAGLFGAACGWMLGWLGESPGARAVAAAISRSFWPLAGYVWLGVVLLVVDPPAPLTVFELVEPGVFETRVGETPGFAWLARLRYVAFGCFLGVAALLLARRAGTWNAILSVAFGVAATAALLTGVNFLAGPEEA